MTPLTRLSLVAFVFRLIAFRQLDFAENLSIRSPDRSASALAQISASRSTNRHACVVRPKSGIELNAIVKRLRECARDVRTVRQENNLLRLRDGYVDWVDETEKHLRSLFVRIDLDELHTERFWRIRDASTNFARPFPLIH